MLQLKFVVLPYSLFPLADDPIPNNGRFDIRDSGRTLRITRIQPADSDVYVCRAESAAGRMEAEAELRVQALGELECYY